MDDQDWPYEGDPPSEAENDIAERVDRIVADLDQAATDFEVFAYLTDAFYRLRCQADAPLTAAQREALMNAFATVRPTLARKIPVSVLGRIEDGLDAAAEHVAWLAGAETFGGADLLAARHARMRLAELETFTQHLAMEVMFGDPTGRPRRLKRIVENEAECLKSAAELATYQRPRQRLRLTTS